MNTKLIIIAISIGLFTFSNAKAQEVKQHKNIVEQVIKDAFTCPMHPDVTQDKPGSCSICGMDLQKVSTNKKTKSQSCCPSPSESNSKSKNGKANCGMSKSKKEIAGCGMKKEMKSKENHKGHKKQ